MLHSVGKARPGIVQHSGSNYYIRLKQFYIWLKPPVLCWERKDFLQNSLRDQEGYTSPAILFLIKTHSQPRIFSLIFI